MTKLFWVCGGALLALGIYITVMNWLVFFNNYVLKKKWTSAIPLIGGMCGGIGILLLPFEEKWKYAWIPLICDWGSIPVFFVSFIFKMRRAEKKNEG